MKQDLAGGSQVALAIISGCLVVTLQVELYDNLLTKIRREVLKKIETKSVSGIVFDLGAVRALDAYSFCHLVDTARMSLLLGVNAVFAGFQPGVVSTLVDLNVETHHVLTFRKVEEGIEHFSSAFALKKSLEQENENEEEFDEDEDDDLSSCED